MRRTRHNTNSRQLGDVTIGGYGATNVRTMGPAQGFVYAQGDAARRFARRRGWTVKTDPRGFVKVSDWKTGNVAFAQSVSQAVWSLSQGAALAKEMSHAYIKLAIEGQVGD